jgi:hypothetical protein
MAKTVPLSLAVTVSEILIGGEQLKWLLSLKPNGCQEKLNQFTLGELIAIPTPDF